jgi:hypothetical protein
MTGKPTENEDMGPRLDRDDLPGAEPMPMDGATSALAREVYWAGDGASRLPGDAHSLRERLDAFAYQMRADEQQILPIGETFLGSTSGWKRGVKRFVWRLTRFSTMRYDRLLADLSEMNAELARRLLATEEELARLHRELDARGGGRS